MTNALATGRWNQNRTRTRRGPQTFAVPMKRSGVSQLPHSITLNGVTVAPAWRYEAKDIDVSGGAGAHVWLAAAGDDLGENAATTDPTPGLSMFFLDDTESVSYPGDGRYVKAAPYADIDEEHFVFECLVAPKAATSTIIGNKYSSGNAGWRLRSSSAGTGRLLLDLSNGVSDRTLEITSVDAGCFHLVTAVADSVNVSLYIDGVHVVTAGRPSGSLSGGATFSVGHTDFTGQISFAQMTTQNSWLNNSRQDDFVKRRFSQLNGSGVARARGSSSPAFVRSTKATIDTVLPSGDRVLRELARRWPRVERRLNANSRNLVTNSEQLNDGSWILFKSVARDDAADAPKGLRATHLLSDGTSGTTQHYAYTSVSGLTIGAHYCRSFAIKAGKSPIIKLLSLDFGEHAYIDLSTGTVGTNTLTGHFAVTPIPDWPGYYHVSWTSTADATTDELYVQYMHTDSVDTWDGSVTEGSVFVTAVQWEQVATVATGPTTYSPKPYVVGYLQEETRTNGFTYSDDLTQAAWNKSLITVSPDVMGTPFGDTRADAVIATSSSSTLHRWRQNYTAVAGTHVFSVFVKKGVQPYIEIALGAWGVIFDMETGAVTSANVNLNSYGAVDYGDGWFRLWANATIGAGVHQMWCYLYETSNGAGSWAGDDVTPGCYTFGYQLELVPSAAQGPSSPISTVAAAATRNADNLSTPSPNNVDIRLGTMACSFRSEVESGSGADRYIMTLHNSTGDERLGLLLNNGIQAYMNIQDGGVQTVNAGELPSVELRDGDAHNMSINFGPGGAQLYRDGRSVSGPGSTSTPNTISTIQIGAREAAAQPILGHIWDIEIYDDNQVSQTTQFEETFEAYDAGRWELSDSLGTSLDITQINNSSLASPLTDEGLLCRRAHRNIFAGAMAAQLFTIDASVADGAFTAVPKSTVSVRSRVRGDHLYIAGVGVGVKTGVLHDSGFGFSYISGYSLNHLHSAAEGALILRVRNADGTSATSFNLGAAAINTWTRIRLDVIAGETSDTLRSYTGVGATGSEVWTLVDERVIDDTSPHWIPWGDATSGKVGYVMRGWDQNVRSYMDRFQAFVTADTPRAPVL